MAWTAILVLEEAAATAFANPESAASVSGSPICATTSSVRGATCYQVGREVGGKRDESSDGAVLHGPYRRAVLHHGEVDDVSLRQSIDDLAAYPFPLLGGDSDREPIVSGAHVAQRKGEAEYEHKREEQGEPES